MKKSIVHQEALIPFTPEGYKQLLEERKKLLSERPDAVEHLKKGREMGDLSENGYYKAARARLSFLDGRIRRIDRLVKLARIVQPSQNGTVQLGNKVTISDGKNEFSYTLVGGYESDPEKKTISHISPIGKAVFGKRVGQTITVIAPAGVKEFIIRSVE